MKQKFEELPPILYQNLLLERISALEHAIKLKAQKIECSKHLENAGHIRIVPHTNVIQYYLITKKNDTRGKYLPRSQNEFAEALIQYDYDKKILKSLKNELSELKRLTNLNQKKSVTSVFNRFSKHKKSIINPVTLSDQEYAKQWQAVPYTSKRFDFSTTEYYTSKGERVRSKSEVIIANTLFRLNIPYRYEYPLELKKQNFTIYPDFCCLNISTRKEFFWEHFGMMDLPEYATNAISKINSLSVNGYIPGKNTIFTWETKTSPLNTKTVEKLIKEYLS